MKPKKEILNVIKFRTINDFIKGQRNIQSSKESGDTNQYLMNKILNNLVNKSINNTIPHSI